MSDVENQNENEKETVKNEIFGLVDTPKKSFTQRLTEDIQLFCWYFITYSLLLFLLYPMLYYIIEFYKLFGLII